MKIYIHLRIHSDFSLIDSIIKIKSLITKILQLKIPAVCVTDENNLYSFIKYYNTSIKNGIKPMLGCDLQITSKHNFYKITFLAMNYIGYLNLIKLTNLSCKHFLQKQYILLFSKGLIVLSGAFKCELYYFLFSKNIQQAILLLNILLKFFHNRFYLEIQRICLQNEEEVLAKSIEVAMNTHSPLIATNDVMFITKKEYEIHKIRVLITDDFFINTSHKYFYYSKEQYFKKPNAMICLFKDIPESIENSIMISIRCNVQVKKNTIYFPLFKVSNNINRSKLFVCLSNKGLNHRLLTTHIFKKNKVIKYKNRLYKELNTIVNMGFRDYFVIVMNFIHWAKITNIPVGPGRGSGAGSLVAFSLEITDVDPIKYDLLFERFLNPDRLHMPDFDVDFCMKKRDKVIDFVTNFYGKKLVAHIVTYSTMTAKSILRDVTRVKGKPFWLGEKLSRLIPYDYGISLTKALKKTLALRHLIDNNEEANEIWNRSLQLEGIIKGIGKHAGGMIIAPTKLTNFFPIVCDEQKTNIIQVDKNDLKFLGLIKFDFLGLRTLTVIYFTLKLIHTSKKNTRDIYNIPLNDLKCFDLLRKAETNSIFQLESPGMKDLIKQIKPTNINDIIALIALFRPGPLNSGMVDEFIKRKNGKYIIYSEYHYSIKPIIRSTYGIILYQEQVMKITKLLTGCSLGKADLFRRAIEKNQHIQQYRINFIKNCVANQLKKYTALKSFELIKKFAGYGFNKSHSAAYGLLSYKTIWLKSNYPGQYMASVFSTEIYNIDKVLPILSECKRMNLKVLPPDINISFYHFSVTIQKNISFGLCAIKGIGKDFIHNLIGNRTKSGLFYDLFIFCNRINLEDFNKRILSALIFSGSLDNVGPSRKTMLYTINTAQIFTYKTTKNIRICINKLFNNTDYKKYEYAKQVKQIPLLNGEKKALGLYISSFYS